MKNNDKEKYEKDLLIKHIKFDFQSANWSENFLHTD